MEFVAPLMLLGLAGIAIPVILHLFNRRTARIVDWGAFRFLESSLLKRKRRLLLEETLLLVTRCLILALAALALARPFIRAQSQVPWSVVLPLMLIGVITFGCAFAMWPYRKIRLTLLSTSLLAGLLVFGAIALERRLGLSKLGRGAARDVAVIVDCSASMALTRDGVSNHDRILKEIGDDIRMADRSTAFGIIQGGAVPQWLTPTPLTDRRVLNETLATLHPAAGTMDAPAAITAAAAMLAQGDNPVKQIIIYGDGQASGWNLREEMRWDVVRAVLAELPSPPEILWRTLELPPSLRNLAIEDVDPISDIVGTDRETTIQVTLRNTGRESVTPTQLTLNVENRELVNRRIGQILPGATRVIEFKHGFTKAGTQKLQASLEAHDDIALDDSATRILHVLGSLDVLLVEGNPGVRFKDQATGFLNAALRPEIQLKVADATSAKPRRFLVSPKVEAASVTARRTSFRDCSVVVLADVPQLPQEVADRLAEFVANGGGLLITPGANIRPEFYNAWTWKGERVIPLPLRTFNQPSLFRRRPSLSPETFVGKTVRNLNTQNDLSRAVIAGWWQLDFSEHPQNVEASLTTGDPFLAVGNLGRGKVAMTAFPLDASLSNLPSLSSFLPFVHEVAYALANPTTAKLNISPSASPTLLLSPGGQLAALQTRGLKGTYYRKTNFSGKSSQRIDPGISFNWGDNAPLPKMPRDNFSVRWTGSFIPPEDGDYNFAAQADDSARVWVNGKDGHESQKLTGGNPYDLRVDYLEQNGGASVQLTYGGAAGRSGLVPESALAPILPNEVEALSLTDSTIVQLANAPTNSIPAQFVHNADGLALYVKASLEPGLYEAVPAESFETMLASFTNEKGVIPFVVLAGIAESDLSPTLPDDLTFLRRFINLTLATKPDDITTSLRGKRFGKEIWRTLAAAALLFVLIELLLARWIAIQRHTGQEEEIAFEKATGAPDPFQKQLAYLRERNAQGKTR